IVFDEMKAIKEGIKTGLISATITQEPFFQGYKSLRIAYDFASEAIVPEDKIIYTKSEIKIKGCF
ncbi:MAG: hypothetical protein ACRCUS_01900, partial [Anaerovoracaceae bacterium]